MSPERDSKTKKKKKKKKEKKTLKIRYRKCHKAMMKQDGGKDRSLIYSICSNKIQEEGTNGNKTEKRNNTFQVNQQLDLVSQFSQLAELGWEMTSLM